MTTRDFLLTAWNWDWFAFALVGWLVIGHLARHKRQPGKRPAYYLAGSVMCLLALVSPIGVLADRYLFSAHMLQHLLLLLIAPALLLLGWPETGNNPSTHSEPAQGSQPGAPRWRTLNLWPGFTWLAGVGAMWLWHAPALCDAATTSIAVHRVQTVSLLAMGLLFWRPVIGPKATRRLPPLLGILYLFSACIACTLLGVYLTFTPLVVCSIYHHPADPLGVLPLLRQGWGLTPSLDQQLGGLMMWVPACVIYVSGSLALLARWYGEVEPESFGPAGSAASPH